MSKEYAVKLIAMIRRKAGISREEFIEYYEKNHVPLILRASPTMADYRRNYVVPASSAEKMHSAKAEYDVITEVWFETKEDFKKWRAGSADRELLDAVAKDELNFIDRSSVRMFLVEEKKSKIER